MKHFTKCMLTLALLFAGVGGSNATKQYLSFTAEFYCWSTWNGTTLSWGPETNEGKWNEAWVFMTANGINGDLSSWTKLHMHVANFNNASTQQLTVVFKKDDGSNPPSGPTKEFVVSPDGDGNVDIDLENATWGECDITNIKDVTIYGCERDDPEKKASVDITDAYLYKPSTGPAEDPKLFTWDNLTFDGAAEVTVDNDKRLVVDSRGWSQYWCNDAYWELPVGARDISAYKYLVIYSTQNASHHEGQIFIEDGNGHSMRGGDYKTYSWKDAENKDQSKSYNPAPVGSMVLDTWSNQHIAVIDLEFLANQDKFGDGSDCKFINTANVTKFGIGVSDEGTYINFAYLTNTLPNVNGDFTRDIESFDKFGTICLPFTAVCSGADIYEIASGDASGISLNRVWGLMEAGKPYFYKTVESEIGYWDNGIAFKAEDKLYFFRAGEESVGVPVANNGLVGTFVDTKAPLNSYVLSGNKLYKVDSDVNIAANKAYIDVDAIAAAPARGTITIGFDETTGIKATAAQQTGNSEIYSLSGQRISQPTKGLYIQNGKKVLVK